MFDIIKAETNLNRNKNRGWIYKEIRFNGLNFITLNEDEEMEQPSKKKKIFKKMQQLRLYF